MPKRSAGLLLFRKAGEEVLLAHPGGPLWARRDEGAWSIPKGEHGPDEDPLAVARREFEEELGAPPPDGDPLPLGTLVQPGRKVVSAFALAGEFDPASLRSNGFEMTLSSRVPDLINEHLAPWMSKWLGEHGLTIDDIQSWAVHPGGPRILRSVCDGLGIDPGSVDISREVLRDHGNMSSPTVLFILDRLRAADAPRPCVALGFGPGLMAEATLFV